MRIADFDTNYLNESILDHLKPRYQGFEMADIADMMKRSSSAQEFADKLAVPGTDTYSFLLARWSPGANERKKNSIPYVGHLLADKLNATSYYSIKPGSSVPWGNDYMGGTGYILEGDDWKVFLDADVIKGTIYLSQISVEGRNQGIGSRVMNDLKEIADNKHWKVIVMKVTNHGFFSKFPWLTHTGGYTYSYNP